MKSLTVDVPVLPRIRKFLRVHYATRIDLVVHDPRLAQLWAMFQTDRTKIREYGSAAPAVPADSISVSLVQYHPSRFGVKQALNVREIRMINILLDSYLYGEFAVTARQVTLSGGTVGKAARLFCDRYDLSDRDLSEDTLRRAWNRQHGQLGGYGDGQVGFDDGLINLMKL